MIDIPERRAIISGIGISHVGRRTGIPGIDLTYESTLAAIADAGLEVDDIDGVCSIGETPIDTIRSSLGLSLGWQGNLGIGGLLSAAMSGCLAVACGFARHVLVYRTVKMMPGTPLGSNGLEPGAQLTSNQGGMAPMLAFHAYGASNWLSMAAQRHMYLYGTTKEQLGWVALTSRYHASMNELAVYREPLTMEDYLSARMISSPFGLFDCDVPVDGSAAFVISSADYAPDCPNPPVRVNAMGGTLRGPDSWDARPDFPRMAASDASAQLWSRTDLKPSDVDFVELYDGFSFLVLAWLEALGLCPEGQSGPFVEGGTRIRVGGDLPVNTYGGQMSAGRLHGYWVLHEACLQLRGQAGERQVTGAEVAAVAAGGGPIAGCLLLTR